MFVTVAICTWNRARLLDQTLAQMHHLRVSREVEWELLVVNNNCTDDTSAVIAAHAGCLPIRELHEPKQGHSHARNCAVVAARGELLIWTDDDVLVEPDWLAEYVRAAQAYPEAAYFGGNVEPWFETDPPAWVRENLPALRGVFAISQGDRAVRPLLIDDGLVGASLAFRTGILRRYQFDPNLGRVKNQLISGDEMDVLNRLRQDGETGVWVGTAAVRHYVPRTRLTTAYARDWFRGGGRIGVRIDGPPPGQTLFGVPLWVVRQYVEQTTRCWVGSLWKRSEWFQAFRARAVLAGMIDEVLDRRRGANAGPVDL